MKVQTQPPHIDGLPVAWQLIVSLIFGLAALGAAYKGYFKKDSGVTAEPQTAAIMGAMIADMGAVRNLSDVCIRLTGTIEMLMKTIDESTHHERNNVEISREVCARLRELVEELERQGKDLRAWDKRDEKRR